ncbi:MAG: hypothetical protein JSS99_00100 [Actinobacteria bacterium]|nr:hypothetical protein [Actinomycetota bacterium]
MLLAVAPSSSPTPVPATAVEAAPNAAPSPTAKADVSRRTGPLSFSSASYTWDWSDLSGADGVEVVVLNDAATPADVCIRLGDLGLRQQIDPTRAAPITTADVVRVHVRKRVPPAGDAWVGFRATADRRLAPGSYTGWVTATDRATKTVARAAVTLTVPSGKVAPRPLVRTLRVTALRWVPFMTSTVDVHEAVIPLDGKAGDVTADRLALDRNAVLGGLSGSGTGTGVVRYDGTIKTLRDGLVGARLAVDLQDGDPGDYSGTIDLPPDDDAGSVDLTVSLKDAVIVPSIVLLIGVLLAFLIRRYLGSQRDVLVLRARVGELAAAAQAAEQAFQRAARGESWSTYAISDLATGEVAAQEAVDRLAAEGQVDSLDTDAVAEVERQLQELKADAETLGQLDDAFRALDAALRTIVELGPIDGVQPDADSNEPAFLTRASEWLDGEPLPAEQLRARLADIVAATTLAEEWRSLRDQGVEDWERVEQLKAADADLGADQRKQRDEAATELADAWNAMWAEPNPSAVVTPERQDVLKRASARIATLTAALEADRAAAGALPDTSAVAMLDTGEATISPNAYAAATDVGLLPTPPDPAERAQAVRAVIQRNDRIVKGVAVVVAVTTGLTALYFGKPFGTWTDYFSALLWGFTATTAIDALATAFGLRSTADRLTGSAAARAA